MAQEHCQIHKERDSFSWIPSNAEADSEARILVPVVYSGPHEGMGKGEGEDGEPVKQMLNSKFQLWAIGAESY